jgi:integrase/recombinase XerC
MPKPFKPTRTYLLPANADLVDVLGRPHVRMKERGRTVVYRVSKDGTKYLKPSKRWHFELREDDGSVKRIKGFADLKATEQLAAEMERKASRARAGFFDPAEDQVRRPLAEHLDDYAAALEAKGNTLGHVRKTKACIASLFTGCGFVFVRDVDAGAVAEWLNVLRRDATPLVVPDGDEFKPRDVAKLLGVSGTAIGKAVKRLRLPPATGNGKARRFPRTTVEALVMRKARGRGPETLNHYVRAVRGFFRWLVRAKRIGSNPLDSLSLVNTSADVRRCRRELTAAELGRLFVAARDSATSFRSLTGRDRYFLYLVAAGTGFRANALANLTPADFDLDASSVSLSARFNKSRKVKVQPLPRDVAIALRDYVADRPANAPLWGPVNAWVSRGAEMLRIDLEAAGIAYAVEGPDGLEYADFHSLRHSFLTLGGRSGIDLRTLQELAGHSKPELTVRYSHRRLYDLTGAVDKLPNLVPTAGDAEKTKLRRTGTDDIRETSGVGPGAVPGAVSGRISLHQSTPDGTSGIEGIGEAEATQTAKKPRDGAPSRRPAAIRTTGASGTRTRNQAIMSRLL